MLAESRQWVLIILMVAGCLSAILQLPSAELLVMGGGVEPTNAAARLVKDWTLGDPYYRLPTGPTAHLSPLFPIYLATLMKLFGHTFVAEILIVVLFIVMHTAYPVLLWLGGWRGLGSEAAGLTAAALAIIWPTFPLLPQWDHVYTANFLLLVFLSSSIWFAADRDGLARPALAGFVTGMLAHWNASSLMITLPWFVCLSGRASRRMSLHWPSALWFLFTLAATVAPWAVRNYLVLGSPVLFRSNLGMELAVSNNDIAAPTQFQNFDNGTFDTLHPNRSDKQAREVAREGEVAYNRRKFAEAGNWVATHPRRFAELTLARVFYFWFPYPGELRGYSYRIWPLTLLSFMGVIRLVRRRHPLALFVVSVLVLYPAVFYLVHTSLRLRLPMIWLEVLMAGYALAPLIERVRHRVPWISEYLPVTTPASAPTSAE